MMWPVLCKVRYELQLGLFRSRDLWGQVTLSLVLNWLVGPLLMIGLAWATLPDLPNYRNGEGAVTVQRVCADAGEGATADDWPGLGHAARSA